MHLDIVDLRTFYSSPLGALTQRHLSQFIAGRWAQNAGLSILGVGYATPYLAALLDDAVRVLAFMPAEQGVVNWPASRPSATALVETTMMPLPDSCVDRVLVVHALEVSDDPRELLAEVWRILTPGGSMILIAPNRGGLWSRVDTTPFGHGQPYSRGQLRDLMRAAWFSPIHWGEALYGPPFARRLFLRLAPAFEAFGARFSLPGAGVLTLEATKQLYRPIEQRRAARRTLALPESALAPGPAGVATRERAP